jgi:hypothetical protein
MQHKSWDQPATAVRPAQRCDLEAFSPSELELDEPHVTPVARSAGVGRHVPLLDLRA